MTAKRAASCPLAFIKSAEILLTCERPACHGRWLGTAKPASAEKHRQAKWFLVPSKKITRAGHRLNSKVILHPKLLKSQNAALLLERGGLTPPCATRRPESSSKRGRRELLAPTKSSTRSSGFPKNRLRREATTC